MQSSDQWTQLGGIVRDVVVVVPSCVAGFRWLRDSLRKTIRAEIVRRIGDYDPDLPPIAHRLSVLENQMVDHGQQLGVHERMFGIMDRRQSK